MRKREGIEPRHKHATVGADVVTMTEGNIKGAQSAMAPFGPTGVEDRGTSPRQSRELGRSSGLFQGGKEGGTTGKPGGSPTAPRKSDVPRRARRWGNAY
jgi:hypothetical protein